ncbi:MAG: hypothetical protein V2J51_02460 [Erythrobacter sp.]|jgi:hypothetical protein|nr:hypothetical protein [Erythrobacter sp.]
MIARLLRSPAALCAMLCAFMSVPAFAQVQGDQLIENHRTQSDYNTRYTAPDGDNRVLLVIVMSEYDLNQDSEVTRVRFGGQNLVSLGTIEGQLSKRNRLSAFYLPESRIQSGERDLQIRYRPAGASSIIYAATLINVDQNRLNEISPQFLRNCTNNGSARPGTINFAPIAAEANDYVFSFVGTGDNDAFTTFNNGAIEFVDQRVRGPGFSFAGGLQVPQTDRIIAGNATLTEGCQNRPLTLQLKFSSVGFGVDGTLTASDPVVAGNGVTVRVEDEDLNIRLDAPDTVTVEVLNDRTGELETVTLIETGDSTGIFEAVLATAFDRFIGIDENGSMNVLGGDVLAITYFDSRTSTNDSTNRTVSMNITDGARTASVPPTLSCPVDFSIFDWQAISWAAGSTNNTYPLGTRGDIGFEIATPGSFFESATLGGRSPTRQNVINGGTGDFALALVGEQTSRSDAIVMNIALPGVAQNAQFAIFDVDFFRGQFADRVEVIGRLNGATVLPTITNGTANEVVGNVAFGLASSDSDSGAGTIFVTFASSIDAIEIRYANHDAAPGDPGLQGIAIHDLVFCVSAARLSVTKVSAVLSDPINGSAEPKAIPGALVEYLITVANIGDGPADAGSLAVHDDAPAKAKLCLLNRSGGPVIFEDASGNSGLSYTFTNLAANGDDLEFSNDGGASFAYTPATDGDGCDGDITDFRVRPEGAFAPGEELRLRVRFIIE